MLIAALIISVVNLITLAILYLKNTELREGVLKAHLRINELITLQNHEIANMDNAKQDILKIRTDVVKAKIELQNRLLDISEELTLLKVEVLKNDSSDK